jgi:hypothetical protein
LGVVFVEYVLGPPIGKALPRRFTVIATFANQRRDGREGMLVVKAHVLKQSDVRHAPAGTVGVESV